MQNDINDFEHIEDIRDECGEAYMVEQGDGSLIPIKGIGPVIRQIGQHTIRYIAYYVPNLTSTPLYSVK